MSDTVVFLDANALASPVTRTLLIAGARYLITTDVDDFASEDLDAHAMSAVNPDYFMALRSSEHAYHEGVRTLAEVAKNPPRTEAGVHMMLGRRHPNLASRFADSYESTPVPPDPDQPHTRFRGSICVRCEMALTGAQSQRLDLCDEHLRGRI
ncbi:MAG: hypothetical protein V9F03_13800 [Microthrixaceae bacterium]